jgi:DNA-directed RNA polymerase specialized sigma24 family protein
MGWNVMTESFEKRIDWETDFFPREGDGHLNRIETNGPKPWENEDGETLADDKLRSVCVTWSPETWEAYLATLESPQRESLFSNFERVLHREDRRRTMEVCFDDSYCQDRIWPGMYRALDRLTFRQRQLINLVFFEGHTLRDSAKQTRLSYRVARRVLQRALDRLKSSLTRSRQLMTES